MRNILKIGIVTSFLLAGAAVFAIRGTDAAGIAAAGEISGELASPRSLYMQNCASCHGSNGKANTAKGRKLEADDLTTGHVKEMSIDRVKRVIANGKGKMPGFGRRLKPDQIAAIAGYIRGL